MSFAQLKRAANWYFPYHNSVTFSSGTVAYHYDLLFNGHEGGASISDKNTGQLLFYTDGFTIYNSNHLIMKNGGGILGDDSSTQGEVIVPVPGSETLYYLFTVGTLDNFVRPGLAYSIIDMTLDGGLGAVITTTKNVYLNVTALEKIAATRHCNGEDYWILTTDLATNGFNAYQITPDGILPPVYSAVGISNLNPIGQLKISPDGKKIAKANMGTPVGNGTIQVFDFNDVTGIVSNPVSINHEAGAAIGAAYGIEFSPNSKRVYYEIQENDSQHLYQIDISNFDPVSINNSKVFIANMDNVFPGLSSMQLGPDGKIYKPSSPYLSIIKNPNEAGTLCEFENHGLLTSDNALGLPNFVSSFLLQSGGTGSCVVPLKLLSFEGNYQSKKINLTWKTGHEINLSHYIVEKSDDGNTFSFLAKVNASATGAGSYSTVDPSPFYGNNFYRLKQVNTDGTFTYSKVINIKVAETGFAWLYPNPVMKDININFETFFPANSLIEIRDLAGRIVFVKKTDVTVKKFSMNVNFLPSGIYILMLKDRSDIVSLKFIKN